MWSSESTATSAPGDAAAEATVSRPEFPGCCLRGLRSPKFVNSEEEIQADAFDPDKETLAMRVEKGLPPGEEVSVNWHVDAGAVEATFRDKKNSAFGAAHVPTEEIKRIAGRTGGLLLEWDILVDNSYHGNIVFRAGVTTQRKRQIQGSLALYATYMPRPNR